MKKETLEEAVKYYAHNNFNMHETNNYKALAKGFEDGAKWQQERSYSEEEVVDLLQKYRLDLSSGKTPNLGYTTRQWFERFKKK